MIVRQFEPLRHFILSIVFAVAVLACPAMAQERSSPPQAATSPAPQANAPQDQKTDPAAKKPDDPNKPDAQIGKSKLEKETGTVNDRIFEVLPNYGTVETSKSLPPLTTGQKYKIATASVFDWAAYPFNAVLAAIAQAKNDPKAYGQG